AIAMRHGPEDAADMMLHTPITRSAMGKLGALDVIRTKKDSNAALAAFDAAYVMQIVAPEGADAAYWSKVAERYRDAAARLTDSNQRALAADHAAAAEQTAKTLGSK